MTTPSLYSALLLAMVLGGCAGADQAGPAARASEGANGRKVVAPIAARINPAKVRTDDPDWRFAAWEVDRDQVKIDAELRNVPSAQLDRFILRRGAGDEGKIALTFDDGPHPEFTPKLLAILKAEDVPATFFTVGFMADKYPSLLPLIKAAGHEIGNHTYSHVTLTKIPEDQVLTEYRANNDVIKRQTGETARYCRPPGGDFTASTLRDAADLGLTTVLWTDDPGDYANPGDQVLYDREVAHLSPGAIILLHDGSQNTVDTLAMFIQTAKRKGFRFVTLDALRVR